MNLVDSSGWLEYFSDGKNADFFAPVLENTEELVVSTINIYEVFKKCLVQKDEDTAFKIISVMANVRIIDTDLSISLLAAKLSIQFKLPMADSLIYATAVTNGAVLWTQDIDFVNVPGVKYIKKK
jgi:toxin FitB